MKGTLAGSGEVAWTTILLASQVFRPQKSAISEAYLREHEFEFSIRTAMQVSVFPVAWGFARKLRFFGLLGVIVRIRIRFRIDIGLGIGLFIRTF